MESSKVHTGPRSIYLSLKTQNTEFFLGDDCFRAEGFLLWIDGGIQDCQAISRGPLPAPCFSHVQNSLWYWCEEEKKSGTVAGETLLTSVGMHECIGQRKKTKQCKEGRRQWRSPGACCVHTEVFIRDVLVKFSGQFRRATSHLGKPQLTLCSLRITPGTEFVALAVHGTLARPCACCLWHYVFAVHCRLCPCGDICQVAATPHGNGSTRSLKGTGPVCSSHLALSGTLLFLNAAANQKEVVCHSSKSAFSFISTQRGSTARMPQWWHIFLET